MKSCATSFEEDHEKRDHPWMTQEIHMLINRRRGESNRHIRRDISKKIQQKMRQAIRKYKDQQIDQVLEEFQDLNRLQQIGIQNKIAESHDKLKDDDFAEMLQAIYADSNVSSCPIDNFDILPQIASFTMFDLEQALSKMKCKKGADHHGIVMEMIKYGSQKLKDHILAFFNNFLNDHHIEQSWLHTLFSMIPKSGNLKEVHN